MTTFDHTQETISAALGLPEDFDIAESYNRNIAVLKVVQPNITTKSLDAFMHPEDETDALIRQLIVSNYLRYNIGIFIFDQTPIAQELMQVEIKQTTHSAGLEAFLNFLNEDENRKQIALEYIANKINNEKDEED